MLPTEGHEPAFTGRIGAELDLEAGRKAARLAVLNVLAVARQHLGSLDKVKRLVRLGVSVATSGDVRDHPKVADAASELLQSVREANRMPLPPKAELAWWYQYYFATERGRAGYEANRNDFAKLIWQIASPQWNFDDATFERTAASFANPDHVSIVIHNYRWRLSLAEGEPQYDDLKRLAEGPVITVPTITLEGDANGAPHPDSSSYARKFSGKYSHRIIKGGVGHNLPQEAPQAFAEAVVDVGY
jgi:pimeloyl-ACP methyl ester carboxylesterase